MNRKRVLSGFAMTLWWVAASFGFGAGFGLYEGSARGNALGGLTGHGDDPAAIFYNPAGITHLEGIQFMGGATLIFPFADLATVNIYDGGIQDASYENNVFTPPHLYYTHQLSSSWWVGLGVYTRFGLGSEFNPNWQGRYNNINANIETLTVNPNIAWKVNDKLSLSLGVRGMWLEAEFEQAIDANLFLGQPPNDPNTSALDAVQVIKGDDYGYGFNVAAHYLYNEKWSFGFQYVSQVEQHIDDGTARFRKPEASVPVTFFVDSNVAADPIDLPEMAFFGVNYKATDRMAVGWGAIYTGWSSIERLRFNYETPFIVAPAFGVSIDEVTRPLNWTSVWRFNVGVQNKITDHFDFMWGAIYDESPLRKETVSYLLPANDRLLFNTGFRWKREKWVLDGSLQYLAIRGREIQSRQFEDGVLSTRVRSGGAVLIGFSVSRTF